MLKLYLVVRKDLDPAQQAVQACHALQAFNIEHPSEVLAWVKDSNTLAFLEATSEEHLGVLLNKAVDREIPAAEFREPDRGYERTAIAIGPSGKALTRNLPKALRQFERAGPSDVSRP